MPAVLPDRILKLMRPEDRPKGVAGMTAAECHKAAVAKTERELQLQLSALLRRHGLLFINPDMRKKSALPLGWPDYSIFLPGGKTIFWEAKVLTALRPEQAKVRDDLEAAGHSYTVITSLLQAQECLKEAWR